MMPLEELQQQLELQQLQFAGVLKALMLAWEEQDWAE